MNGYLTFNIIFSILFYISAVIFIIFLIKEMINLKARNRELEEVVKESNYMLDMYRTERS